MKKLISILGSTGSVGVSTLKIIDRKKNFFKIHLLSANNNFKQICNQIKKYKPNIFLIFDYSVYKKVKKNLRTIKPELLINLKKIYLQKKMILQSQLYQE